MPSNTVTKLILDAVSLSGVSKLLKPFLGGAGGILMLHRVEPVSDNAATKQPNSSEEVFAPNSGLTITPQFLDKLITELKSIGMEFVNLDEAVRRIEQSNAKPFVTITLDDGYKDNAEHAAPIFQKHQTPYTIYVAPGLVDGRASLWWEDLEYLIRDNDMIELKLPSDTLKLATKTIGEKYEAYEKAMQVLTNDIDEEEQREIINALCAKYGQDAELHRANSIMNWDELKAIANNGLCSLGAHTIHHYAVARLSDEDCAAQLKQSADEIEVKTGKRPKHFAYPYGYPTAAGARDFKIAKELGFKSAVTTRHGVCYEQHKNHLTALPRISVNGNFQKPRYLKAMLCGVTTILFNKGNKLNIG